MTEGDMRRLIDGDAAPVPVTVMTVDYAYDGWVIGAVEKRSGVFRVVIEDASGRLFIHSPQQVRSR
jgi:hypothetical protein